MAKKAKEIVVEINGETHIIKPPSRGKTLRIFKHMQPDEVYCIDELRKVLNDKSSVHKVYCSVTTLKDKELVVQNKGKRGTGQGGQMVYLSEIGKIVWKRMFVKIFKVVEVLNDTPLLKEGIVRGVELEYVRSTEDGVIVKDLDGKEIAVPQGTTSEPREVI